jgi:hypothetical protein
LVQGNPVTGGIRTGAVPRSIASAAVSQACVTIAPPPSTSGDAYGMRVLNVDKPEMLRQIERGQGGG